MTTPAQAPYHLSSFARHPLLDYPQHWHKTYRAPEFDVRGFQERINRITGTTLVGQPLIRLVWSWESRELRYGVWRAKYRFLTVDTAAGPVDISPPRWIFEERYEPGQYWQSWAATRYAKDPDTGERVDVRGEPPREGWYNYLMVAGDATAHDPEKRCCERVWETGRKRCWGYYREPSQYDLDHIARIVRRKEIANFGQDPNEPLTEAQLEEAQREAFAVTADEEEARREETHERWEEHLRTHGHRMTSGENAKILRHGKFQFLGQNFKESESGRLVIPE